MAKKFYSIKVLLTREHVEQLKQMAAAEEAPLNEWRYLAGVFADLALAERIARHQTTAAQAEAAALLAQAGV